MIRLRFDPRALQQVLDVQPTANGEATVVLACGHYLRGVSETTNVGDRERCEECPKRRVSKTESLH
jgi:hypothetical protein